MGYCKYCEEVFETEFKFSKVCDECKENNHKIKCHNNLFNGNNKRIIVC